MSKQANRTSVRAKKANQTPTVDMLREEGVAMPSFVKRAPPENGVYQEGEDFQELLEVGHA